MQIDQWVVRNALRWIAAHPDIGVRLTHVAINLSGRSIVDPQMAEYIERQFQQTLVAPEKICFEVTETEAIANLDTVAIFFDRIKRLGCELALDDFGVGFSSFEYLKHLPADYLKIDGTFVGDVAVDTVHLAMVKSINELGHVTGKKTIAEFVENVEIASTLRDLGVDYAQGYGIGMPRPLEMLNAANVVPLKSTA